MTAVNSLRLILAGAAVLVVCILAPAAHAQYDIPGLSASLIVLSDPASPSAGERVRLSAESFTMDLSSGTITWYIGGVKVGSGEGLTSIETNAPALGKSAEVRVEANGQDGDAVGALTLRGTTLSILWEADSYTPPLHLGRALASPGSNVRAQVMTHFVRQDGSRVKPSDIVYTWYKNGNLLRTISGRGADTARFESPQLFATDVVTVEAVSADRAFSASASVRIPSVEPILELYEDHPLYGIVWERAIGRETTVYDTQATFITIPLFAAASSPTQSSLVYEWNVNGTPLQTDPKAPNAVRITAPEGGGGNIGVDLSLAGSFFGDAAKSWNFSFIANTSRQSSGPFGIDTK